MIDKIDIDALEQLALVATPGPWTASCRHVSGPIDGDLLGISKWPDGEFLGCDVHGPNTDCGRGDYVGRDAAYVASVDPTTILSLIQRLRKAEDDIRERDELRDKFDRESA
jgi:hypothetical protein